MKKTLKTLLSFLIVLGIVLSASACGAKKSTSGDKKSNGMLQPGAASMDELIDTLASKYIFSDKSIKMMSNSMLCWMAEEINDSDVLKNNTGEIRNTLEEYLKGRNKDEFEDIVTQIRVKIEETEKIDTESIYEDAESENNKKIKEALSSETDGVESVYATSGTAKLQDGSEKEDFEFEDELIYIVKVDGRYYWYAPEMF